MASKLTLNEALLEEAKANIVNVQDLYKYAVEQGLEKQAQKILSDHLIKVDEDGRCSETSANASSDKAYIALRRLVDGLDEAYKMANKLILNEGNRPVQPYYYVYAIGPDGIVLDEDAIDFFTTEKAARKFAEKYPYSCHIVFVPMPNSDEGPEYAEYIKEKFPYEDYEIIDTFEKGRYLDLSESVKKSNKLTLNEDLFDDEWELDTNPYDVPDLDEDDPDYWANLHLAGYDIDDEDDEANITKWRKLESFNEDLFLAPQEPSDETPATSEANGIAKLILDAINDESDTIKMYNDLIANTDNEDIIKIIQDITAEENNHLGMLQRALEIVSPNASNIEDGVEEAQGMIADEQTNVDPEFIPVAESLSEDLHDKFKRDIKNNYKSWVAKQEKVEKARKEMLDMLDDTVSEETREKWTKLAMDRYPDVKFEYNFPKNIEKDDYPFYVTYYAEYPIYEPAEGGYYYPGRDAVWSEGFNSEEEAREFAKKYVTEDGDDWQEKSNGYELKGKYIGQDQSVNIEPQKAYLGAIAGWHPYE